MRPATVLVVEDNSQLAEALSGTLMSSGYQVVTCGSGEEALELFVGAGAPVDLVITDTSMPKGMSGLDLIARIRAVHPGQRILRISAFGGMRHDDGDVGVSYLAKPFDSAMLLDRVTDLLGPQPGAHAGHYPLPQAGGSERREPCCD